MAARAWPLGTRVKGLRPGPRGTELAPGTVAREVTADRPRFEVTFTDGQTAEYSNANARDYVLKEES